MNNKVVLIVLVAMLLTACSNEENFSVRSNFPETTEQVVQKEKVTPAVIVYGLTSVTNGFVIEVDERKKWLVTIASAVSEHPNALVETSAGQILKAQVVAIDESQNIAILTFKNSATIEPFTLAKQDGLNEVVNDIGAIELTADAELASLTTINHQNGKEARTLVQPSAIKSLLAEAQEKPLKWQERYAKNEQLSSYSVIGTELLNKIETYEKSTFDYNPDALMAFVDRYQKTFNDFLQSGDDVEISSYIASDDLLAQLQEITESYKLGELSVQSINVSDNLYSVECKTTLQNNVEEKDIRAVYKVIKMNNEWKLISAVYE
ncbi:hypothetical protein [Solibacillus sp. FSL H8-0538]|uniref:hypothetical protein n=1 Tax=Solibacillus sp. FSL H8-0538 TaxID=2921400 RepID=UPI0030F6D014